VFFWFHNNLEHIGFLIWEGTTGISLTRPIQDNFRFCEIFLHCFLVLLPSGFGKILVNLVEGEPRHDIFVNTFGLMPCA
jgi:hypothetical protein